MVKEKQTWKPSMGLAFSEDKEMKMLSKMASEGWVFYSYKFLGYKFIKGEPQDLIYCNDMHRIGKGEKEQYFSLFEAGGWSHVCSVGKDIHYFCAAPGTKPIYTDRDTLSEKYKYGTRGVFLSVAVLILVLIASITVDFFIDDNGLFGVLSLIVNMITGACIGLIPVMTIAGILMKVKTKGVRCK